jgi:hypothetical protein
MKSTGLFFLPELDMPASDPSEYAYIRFLKATKVFEISGGVDFEAAVKAFLQWMQSIISLTPPN